MEAQLSIDSSILERQVTAAADIQACKVTGNNQPDVEVLRTSAPQRLRLLIQPSPPTNS